MSRHKPKKIKIDKQCDYGCGNSAHYQFKSGKLCCNDAIQKCQGHIRRGLKTRRKDIDENGLNPMQRGQSKAMEVRDHKTAGRNISNTKQQVNENGIRNCDLSNAKMKKTKLTIGQDGLTNAQRSARKAADIRLNDIDENGLNQYQRWTNKRIQAGTFEKAFKKSRQIKPYEGTELYYQGTYEKRFLDRLVEKYGLAWVNQNVNRGPTVKYIINEYERNYLSDFIIGNTIYEIKSNWTWNRRGKDLQLEKQNIAKLTASIDAGYNVKLIREGKEIDFIK